MTANLPAGVTYEHEITCPQSGLRIIFGSQPSTWISQPAERGNPAGRSACTKLLMYAQPKAGTETEFAALMGYEGALPPDNIFLMKTGRAGFGNACLMNVLSALEEMGEKAETVSDSAKEAIMKWVNEFDIAHPAEFPPEEQSRPAAPRR